MSKKELCEQGAIFEKVKVHKVTYGGSYQVKLPDQIAFLHKSHLPGKNVAVEDEDQDPDKPKKKAAKPIDELSIG